MRAGKRRKQIPTRDVFFRAGSRERDAEDQARRSAADTRMNSSSSPPDVLSMNMLLLCAFAFFATRSEDCVLISLVCGNSKKKKKKNCDMHYLPLLRPEPVKSQPTASEFNWRAQMFGFQWFLRCPRFFFFPLESYSSAVGSLSALA